MRRHRRGPETIRGAGAHLVDVIRARHESASLVSVAAVQEGPHGRRRSARRPNILHRTRPLRRRIAEGRRPRTASTLLATLADSSLVASYTYLQPVITTVLAAIFLGERIRAVAIVAGVLIFAGVYLAGGARKL